MRYIEIHYDTAGFFRVRALISDNGGDGRVVYVVQALYQWRQIPGGPLAPGEITTAAEVC